MSDITRFRKKITVWYRAHGRDLPWRRTHDPYSILISEIMLQQTQVERVKPFYEKFIKRFPRVADLAVAEKTEVLLLWQGLGYNRRALALREAARIVVRDHAGVIPRERNILESLPGIGPYTAGALRVFAWNEPDFFIETNIRRVFIHFFFEGRGNVRDVEIMSWIVRAGPSKRSSLQWREWYFALMDYGAMLGAHAISSRENPNRRSAHYARQSTFAGSDREIRGKILRLMLARKKVHLSDIYRTIPQSQERVLNVINALCRESFLKRDKDIISV